MARIGLYPALIIVVFGIVAPFFIFKLGRFVGFPLLLGLACVIGLAYGALKAEYSWYGQGALGNAMFMAASSRISRLRCAELQRGQLYRPNAVIGSWEIGASLLAGS